MKQDKAEKIIQRAERKAEKAAKQVEAVSKKAEVVAQKQAARAEKKATQKARSAEKKAAKQSKKAEQATKKAQLAAKKAEEKKSKIAAKAKPSGEGEGEAPKKKKSKKKLLLILLPVVVAVAGAGAFFFLKGGKEAEEPPPEPIAAPAEYVLNEAHIAALPVWGTDVLVYQEEIVPTPPEPPEGENAGGEEAEPAAETTEEAGFTKILYRYENLQDPGSLVAAYTALMITEDAGFSVVDETLLRIDPPELEGQSSGTIQLARNAPAVGEGEAGVHYMLLEWGGTGCSVTLDMPEGRVRDPKPATTPSSSSFSLADLKAMHPSKLGLPGESMDAYDFMPQDGAVRIANVPCQRVNVYDGNNQIVGSYFISNNGKLYKLDEAANGVVELELE